MVCVPTPTDLQDFQDGWMISGESNSLSKLLTIATPVSSGQAFNQTRRAGSPQSVSGHIASVQGRRRDERRRKDRQKLHVSPEASITPALRVWGGRSPDTGLRRASLVWNCM